MKCLEKDRNRRYETPNSLAREVERYLHDQPVQACPPSPAYRIRKFVRRNKLALAAGSLIVVALVIGVTVAMIGFYRARTEGIRSEQISTFLAEMLEGVGPNVALGRDTTLLREIVDRAAQRLGTELKEQPSVEADLRNTIGAVYLEIGERTKAEDMHRQALAIRKKLYGNESIPVAESLNRLANTLQFENKLEEAEKLAQQSLAIRRKLLGSGHTAVADSLNNLAYTLATKGRLLDAELMVREALAIQRKSEETKESDLVQTLNNLARVLSRQQRLEDAEAALREATDVGRRLEGGVHPALAFSLINLTNILRLQGKLEQADALKREADTMQTKLFGLERSD
jgi:eukaryotic-like serine/threonine-protein kinase